MFDNGLYSEFFCADLRLLKDDFADKVKFGMHNVWDKSFKHAYDPLFYDNFTGCYYEEEEVLSNLQQAIGDIYTLYGEAGLNGARGFALATGVVPNNWMYEDSEYPNQCLGTENYEDVTPSRRAIDFLKNPLLMQIPNDNIRAALFSCPQLLYKDGKLVSEEELVALLDYIMQNMYSNGLCNIPCKLDKKGFIDVITILRKYYIDNYLKTDTKVNIKD